MNIYEVWFELYGKKMKTTIKAANMADAQYKIRNAIIFHKTVLEEKSDPDVAYLKGMFGMS